MKAAYNNRFFSWWIVGYMLSHALLPLTILFSLCVGAGWAYDSIGYPFSWGDVFLDFYRPATAVLILIFAYAAISCKNRYEIHGDYLLIQEYALFGRIMDMRLHICQIEQIRVVHAHRWNIWRLHNMVEIKANGQTYCLRAYDQHNQLCEAIHQKEKTEDVR